ncbi:hypothetical protein KIH41_12685 [Litoribacter ruber]|uniref:hypothetical protein n=1 Tax=Litoribacter ruber TaxID=702568 RepID=UPI001BD9CE4A|nr:hypothetical protein [Litoribacter ruber]MBT0812133.1 hypothetical protein [Litoribacter ruber]
MIKNNLIRLQKGFLALMSVSLLFACSQVDSFEAEDMSVLRSSAIVQEACFEGNVSSAVTFSGAYQNKQTVSLNVSNDTEFVYLDFTSSTAILYINGERVNKKNGAHAMKVTHEEFASMKTFEIRRTGEGHGACAPGNCLVLDASAYQIVMPCDDNGCEDSLTVERNGDVFTFTLIPSETEENGRITMTLAQSVAYKSMDGKAWSSRNGGNAIEWNGALTACEPITFELELIGDCGANLATTFNVKGDGNLLNQAGRSVIKTCE